MRVEEEEGVEAFDCEVDVPLALLRASSISCSLSPLVSKNSTFLLSGDSATLGSLRKLTALFIKSSFILLKEKVVLVMDFKLTPVQLCVYRGLNRRHPYPPSLRFGGPHSKSSVMWSATSICRSHVTLAR